MAHYAKTTDPIYMQQVIINLVMNGMDAMEEVPTSRNLTIRTRRDNEPLFSSSWSVDLFLFLKALIRHP